jgi:hypothetical protein
MTKTYYSYDLVAGSRREPRGVLRAGMLLAEAHAAKADYSIGRGCPRYIKRIARPVPAQTPSEAARNAAAHSEYIANCIS